MDNQNFTKYIKTEKQKQFDTDFFRDAESYEVWEEIDFSNINEIDGQLTFEIKAEDMKFYSEAIMDVNPLMND